MKKLNREMEEAVRILDAWEPTRIVFGEGSVRRVGGETAKMADRVLVVIGQGSVKTSGVLDGVLQGLKEKGVRYDVCAGVEPNPSKETVYRIAYRLLAGGFPAILAVGGGSVMDAAKAAGILATVREGELDDYFGAGKVSAKVGRIMPLLVVPTTSGTGSDFTKFSVVTDTAIHVKKLILDKAIVPREAIIDPELTYSCSRHVSMVSGLDTMTHLMEGYLNTVDENADPGANGRALTGLALLFEGLPRVLKDGQDGEARRMMALASALGGSVLFFKQAGGPHLNSFSWCNVMDHGEACAVMLPYYAAYYAPVVREKLETLARILGVTATAEIARDFAEGLLGFYRKIDFPATLKAYPRFSKEMIEKAVSDASQNRMKLEAMPRPVPPDRSAEVLRTIIQGAYDGRLDEIVKL
jgi:alcohol dehydrogenase class IV